MHFKRLEKEHESLLNIIQRFILGCLMIVFIFTVGVGIGKNYHDCKENHHKMRIKK